MSMTDFSPFFLLLDMSSLFFLAASVEHELTTQ